jgi:hypothetical protein
MFNTPYYNKTLRKVVVAFGNLFSNIKIERENSSGVVTQTINVPLAYGPKEKQIVRVDSDPTLDHHTRTVLPRMSFQILGYNYDSSRKVNKMSRITCQKNDGTRTSMFSPAPYNVGVALYLHTKSSEDAYQVLEQVLPLFTPEYTISLNVIPTFNLIENIPIILNSVDYEDDYEGDFESKRSVIHTFQFTIKLNFYNEVNSQSVIKHVIANVTESPSATFTADGTLPGDPITENWVEQ